MVDTGANVVMVPTGDPSILEETLNSESITSSGGLINATECKILTPVGVQVGYHVIGAPRILPGFLFSELREISSVSHLESGSKLMIEWREGLPVVQSSNLETAGMKVYYSKLTMTKTVNFNYGTHQNCDCRHCQQAKLTHAARRKSKRRTALTGEVIVGDLCTNWPGVGTTKQYFWSYTTNLPRRMDSKH